MGAQSVPARLLFDQIQACGVSHVLTVPDTHQKTLLALLASEHQPELLTVCTEDEAVGINLGLYAGGKRPMLLIQNNGLYACLNAIKALSLDARVPLFMAQGQIGGPDSSYESRAYRMTAMSSGDKPSRYTAATWANAGQRSAQGRAASMAAATRRTPRSSPSLPTT
ncbi:MAG: thiamine pyrophosphate-binding protein [Chloroflexota bacterium]